MLTRDIRGKCLRLIRADPRDPLKAPPAPKIGIENPPALCLIPAVANSFEVIVVGVGAMGAATCWALAKRGVRVLGLEQFDIPHTRGSSHGWSRMTRMAYCEHPDYVPLIRRANELWRELEKRTCERVLYLPGGLYLGPPDGRLIAGVLRSAREHNLPHEYLKPTAVTRRYPQFTLPAGWVGLLEPGAGYLLPEMAISALTTMALRLGAEIHGHEPVLSWTTDQPGVSVQTPRGTYHAERIIFCGGPWSSKLVRDLGVELKVTRQVLGWVWPRDLDSFRAGNLPVWMIDGGEESIYYGFPVMTLSPGLKLAHHGPQQPTDPDQVERGILPGDEASFRRCLERFMPTADGPTLAIRTCLYTRSPDEHFILDRHPGNERVSIACGFSGHGFKFASVIGEAMADLSLRGQSELPIGFLGLKRFMR